MRPVTQIVLGMLLGGVAAVLLSSDVQLERISAAMPRARAPLLVVVLDNPSALAAVRAAVREERIVVERPGGFALAEGRVVAAGYAAASKLISAAGWAQREIQLGLSVPPQKERRASAAAGLTRDRIAWSLRGCVILGGALVALGLRKLWRRTLARRRRAAFLRSSQPPILVLRMAGGESVRVVRAATPTGRVFAESDEAFALEGGWIVTGSDGAASQLLAAAGWKDRVLETHHPDPFGSAARRDAYGTLGAEQGLERPTAKSLWSSQEAILVLQGEGALQAHAALKSPAGADDSEPMLVRLALLVVLLLVSAPASANPLVGVWRSDRDLTLLEMEKLSTLTLEQREVLSTSGLFGQLVATYGDREIEFRLAEGSTRLSYRIVATGSDFVEIEYADEQAAEPVRKRLLLHGGLLHVPVEHEGFHEVFRRIDAPAALAP